MDRFLSLLIIFSLSLAGCASTPTVKRLSPADAIDLSGRWNDEDSRLVSEELIQQSLSSGWAEKYRRDRGRLPAVIVGRVKNMTYEHINSETFMKDIERALLNSGLINFIASSAERDEIRSEREEMQTWASIDTRSSLGRESGADYMIRGIISSIYDEEAGKRVVYYQVDLSLIDLEDNIIIWAGQKSIKKLIKRPLFSF